MKKYLHKLCKHKRFVEDYNYNSRIVTSTCDKCNFIKYSEFQVSYNNEIIKDNYHATKQKFKIPYHGYDEIFVFKQFKVGNIRYLTIHFVVDNNIIDNILFPELHEFINLTFYEKVIRYKNNNFIKFKEEFATWYVTNHNDITYIIKEFEINNIKTYYLHHPIEGIINTYENIIINDDKDFKKIIDDYYKTRMLI